MNLLGSPPVKHVFAIIGLLLCAVQGVQGDVVVTQAGQRHEGKLTLQSGAVKIGTTVVALRELREFIRTQPAPTAPTDELTRLTANLWVVRQPAALSWNGTLITGRVTPVDDTKVSFRESTAGFVLSTANTAAVFFTPMAYHQLEALRSRGPGVLLKGGDFFEGRLLGLRDGRVEIESILFGRKSFAVGSEAEALWLRPPKAEAASFTVRTRNGSVILAGSVVLTADGVEINQPPLRKHRIPFAELVQLQQGNAVDVVTMAWRRVDQAKPEEKTVLLASVANVGRMLDLRSQVNRQSPALKLANEKLQLADKKRTDIRAANEAARREYDRLRRVWSQRNGEYLRIKAGARNKANKLRQKQAAVRRVRAEMDRWRKQLKSENQRLQDAEKALAGADEKQRNGAKGRRDAAKRQIDQSMRQFQRSEQRLLTEQRGVEAFNKTIQPAKDEEKAAKEKVDAAYRAKEDAQAAQRKGLDAWRGANKEYFSLLSTRNRLQSEYNAAMQELEQIRPAVPDAPR